jgi:predicted amidophosphoribosyltransferase
MYSPILLWVLAVLAGLLLYLLLKTRGLRKRLVAQHYRLQLADTNAQQQERQRADQDRAFAEYKSLNEVKLLTVKNQLDAQTAQNHTLLTAQNEYQQETATLQKRLTNALKIGEQSSVADKRQQERLVELENHLTTALLEQERLKKLVSPAVEQREQQLATLVQEKENISRQHQQYAIRLTEQQRDSDALLRQLLSDLLPIARQVMELVAGPELVLPAVTPRRQADALLLAFKQQIGPALTRLADKLKAPTAQPTNSHFHREFQQQFYQVSEMDGHPYMCLHPYLPTRYQASAAEQATRSMVYSFKDGANTTQMVEMLAIIILRAFPAQHLAATVLVVVPASTAAKNEVRFKRFCELLCQKTGLANGYAAIRPASDREAFKGQTGVNKTANLLYNTSLIAHRRILLFDDVMTTGASFKQNARLLKQHGAEHITGLFLARTVNR